MQRPPRAVERSFAILGFPLLMSTCIGGSIWLMRRGVEPSVTIALFIVFGLGFLGLAERVIPQHRSWLHSKGDLRTDIGLAAVNGAWNQLLLPLLAIAAAGLGLAISGALGSDLWPEGWPLLAQLALALVVGELFEYGFHRAMHEVPILWRWHATHHSAPRLYWLNAARFHPIDLFLVGGIRVLFVALLGAGAEVVALVAIFAAVHGAYQHANVPVKLGPLNWIFSMTELHRWHHSPDPSEANHNYGGNLIVWDVVFGTRWLPDDREPPEQIGIGDLPDFPMGFGANLLVPFRWRRTVAASRPGAGSASASSAI